MVAFQKFQPFVEALAEKKHDLSVNQLAVALTNSAPLNTYFELAQITEISYANCSSRNITTVSSSQTAGTYNLILGDLTLTAGGGPVGPFRYVVLYNTVAAGFELIGWWDYGSAITLNDTETFLIDFPAIGVVQIT